jgi:hypothetical protein
VSLFDRNKPPQAPAVAGPANKYTVENIQVLLDVIGLMRLEVNSARMKVLVSAVAWETQKYLDRNFTQGPPPGRIVAELQEQLTMVKNVVTTYIEIQNNPDAYARAAGGGQRTRGTQTLPAVPGPQLLENGCEALRRYLAGVTAGDPPDITGYVVDTKILSTHFK